MVDGRMVVRGGVLQDVGEPARTADLYVADGVVVSANAIDASDERVTVIDATGATVLPLVTRSAVRDDGGVARAGLAVGSEATFAVVRGSARDPLDVFIASPPSVVALVVHGVVEVQDGTAVRSPDPADAPWVATWTDARARIEQHLSADGRYSETRSGRRDAYTGRYWTRGDRIVYRDDSGFWAHGERRGDVVHHAGFLLARETDR